MANAKKREIIPGEQFGWWTIIEEAGRVVFPSGQSQRLVHLKCVCGKLDKRAFNNLISGKSKSCGCRRPIYFIGNTHALRHGSSNTSAYKSWISMKKRCCENACEIHVKNYFLRGIRVCARWQKSFQNFLDDMGPRPKGTSIDRIDNDGNYEPGNCRWATSLQQNRNRRCSRNEFQSAVDAWRRTLPSPVSRGMATMLLAEIALKSIASAGKSN